MKLRTTVLPGLIAVALVSPASASAASLNVGKPCYGPGEKVVLSGGGFTPGGPVALSVGGRQLGVGTANAVGEVEFALAAPTIRGKRRSDLYTATDQTNLALAANVPVHVSSLDVKVTPKNGNPAQRKRVVARGFTGGKTLYAHVRRGKSKRNVRVGRLKGGCGTLDVKRRLFPADAEAGGYDVQFDTKRRYSAKTVPHVSFLVTVFHTFKLTSAAALVSYTSTSG